MIKNFDELVILCGKKRDELNIIQSDIRYHVYLQNQEKTKELYQRKMRVKKQILNYLDFYEKKYSKNHLDKMISGKEIEELKIYFDNYFIKKYDLLNQIKKFENYMVDLNTKFSKILLVLDTKEFSDIVSEFQKTRFSLKKLHQKITEYDYFE